MLFDDETAVPGIDERPDLEGGLEIATLLVVPIVDDDQQTLGVLEAVNRDDGEPFEESDLAVMREIAERLSVAVPPDLRRDKGWIGTLLETALGATGGSAGPTPTPEPTPEPTPYPAQERTPEILPVPAPQPTPDPDLGPTPAPIPEPTPEPTPIPDRKSVV